MNAMHDVDITILLVCLSISPSLSVCLMAPVTDNLLWLYVSVCLVVTMAMPSQLRRKTSIVAMASVQFLILG